MNNQTANKKINPFGGSVPKHLFPNANFINETLGLGNNADWVKSPTRDSFGLSLKINGSEISKIFNSEN